MPQPRCGPPGGACWVIQASVPTCGGTWHPTVKVPGGATLTIPGSCVPTWAGPSGPRSGPSPALTPQTTGAPGKTGNGPARGMWGCPARPQCVHLGLLRPLPLPRSLLSSPLRSQPLMGCPPAPHPTSPPPQPHPPVPFCHGVVSHLL